MWPRACCVPEWAWEEHWYGQPPQVQNAPICKELRVECVCLQGCLHGTWFPKFRQFKKKEEEEEEEKGEEGEEGRKSSDL